jgi:AraC-like DNA-binding protein
VLSVPRHAPALSRHCFESTIASTVKAMHTLTGEKLHPLEVEFSSPAPSSTAEYRRVLGCPVHFGRKQTSFTLDMKVAGIPVLLPNKGMLEHFENFARSYLAEIEGDKPATRAVTHLILSQLDHRRISIGSVAREMGMSTRTLQLRLKSEETVWSDLLEDTRERLAKKYLRENYTVEDITFLLGFSEPSVFRKAFKKWAGNTPAEYRKLAVAGGRL